MGSQGTETDIQEKAESAMAHEKEPDQTLWFGWLKLRPRGLQILNNPKSFLFFVCMYFFTQSIVVNGVYSVSITTIEKRFGFSSSKTGVLTSCYDIACLLVTPFVSYLGARRKKPKWCGVGLLVMGVGFFIFILPHLFSEKYMTGSGSQEVSPMCGANMTRTTDNNDCHQSQSSHWSYYLLFVVGMLVIGSGSTPMWNLGTAFMDENVKVKTAPMYIGIFSCSGVVGAGVGFLLGGLFLSIYVDLGVKTYLTPKSEQWVGAWWLGFLVSTVLALLWSVWLAGFPKEFPNTQKLRKLNKIGNSDNPSSSQELGYVKLQDLPKASKALFSKIPYVAVTLGVCIEGFLISAFTAFMPKVIEQQFRYSASRVSLLMGAVVIPGALLGNFIGAYICKRLNLRQRGAAKMCFMVSALSTVGVCLLFLNCDTPPVVGVNTPYTNTSSLGLTSLCNYDCLCSDVNYRPVCGDGVTYFSSCHAGCVTDLKNGSFSGCSCLKPGSLVTSGYCSSDCGLKPLFYIFVYFLVVFLTFLSATPATIVTLRSVANDQRAYALGIQSSLLRLLGSIPGPIVVGALIDMTCTLWSKGCHNTAYCLQYNNRSLAMVVLVTSLIAKVTITICYSLAQLFCPKEARDDSNNIVNNERNESQFKNKKDKDVEQNTAQEPEAQEVPEVPKVKRSLVHEFIDRETKI